MPNVKSYALFPLIFCLGIAAVTLYWSFEYAVPYEIPKIILFNRFVEILAILTLVRFKHLHNKSQYKPILFLILLFFLTAVFSALQGVDVNKSIWGNYYRGDGLFTLAHLMVFSVVISIWWKAEYFKWFTYTAMALNLGISVIVIQHYFTLPSAIWVPFFGQPNFLAGYLLTTLPFALFHLKKHTYLSVSSILFSCIAIYLTSSTASMLGLALFAVGVLWLHKKVSVKTTALISVLLVAIGIGYFLTHQTDSPEQRIAESRERIYTKALLAVKEKPILGWGWANFDYAFSEIDWPIRYEQDAYVDKAHGHILEIISTTGIIGVTIYLALVFYMLKRLQNSPILLLGLILFLFHSQTNVISVAQELYFWFFVGVALTTLPFGKRSERG